MINKSVIVTGAHGFLGRYAARRFAEDGYVVTGVGHGNWERSEFSEFGISSWHSEDVGLELLMKCEVEPSFIVHCSGGASVPFSISDPIQDFQRTVANTAIVLEYIRLHSPKTILVYPSSAAVYGRAATLPISENDPLRPISPYGVHKLLAEQLCKSYAENFRVSVAVVRFFSLYGEGLRKQLLWDACSRFKSGVNEFCGTGLELRDWLHVEDAADLLFLAATHGSTSCPVVNGGSGDGVSVRNVLEMLVGEFGGKSDLDFSGVPRSGDPPGYQADTSTVKSWGWESKVSLREGIQRYAAWFKEDCV